MKLLFENWREYLKEQAVDESRVRDVGKHARKFTNYMIKNLKARLDKFPEDATGEDIFGWDARSKSKLGDINTIYGYVDSRTGKEHEINVKFDMQTHPNVTADRVFSTGGGYLSWKEQEKAGTIYSNRKGADYLEIKLRFSKEIVKRDIVKNLQKIYMGLIDVAAHELEHQTQDAEGRWPREGFITASEDLEAYLLQPHEVEAFSRGFYTVAVKTGTPFEAIVEEAIDDRLVDACNNNKMPNCGDEMFAKFKIAILDYAKKQLPCAQDKEGRPLNPTACKKPSSPAKGKADTEAVKGKITSLLNRILGRAGEQ